jgi:trans-aconitate 2-methyltransferase
VNGAEEEAGSFNSMSSVLWNPQQYLQFEEERTRPCRDLASRVAVDAPKAVIDLGCGPGNSTAVLAERWPGATVTGLDNSAEMLATARAARPRIEWLQGDIAEWASSGGGGFDVVFSNAALQWVGNHGAVFPRLMRRVAEGGALAVQMPSRFESPAHRVTRELACSERWQAQFGGVKDWFAHEASFYYDALAPLASRVDLWETEYLHLMDGPEGILEWYRGTGLRPYLSALGSDVERTRFAAEYLEGIRETYPRQIDGRVLFPFRRIFVVAYKGQ